MKFRRLMVRIRTTKVHPLAIGKLIEVGKKLFRGVATYDVNVGIEAISYEFNDLRIIKRTSESASTKRVADVHNL